MSQMGVLVMENRRHSQQAHGEDSYAKNQDRTQAVAPSDLHRTQGNPDFQESHIGLIQRNGFDHFQVLFPSAALGDLAHQSTIAVGVQNKGVFFPLSDPPHV